MRLPDEKARLHILAEVLFSVLFDQRQIVPYIINQQVHIPLYKTI